jgi:predicted nucleotidyltransferase
MRPPVTKQVGMRIAQELRKRLLQKGYPIRSVLLYGSIAHEQAHEWSDIDIAIVCDPCMETRFKERSLFSYTPSPK